MEWFVFNFFTVDRGIGLVLDAIAFAIVVYVASEAIQVLTKLKRKHYPHS